MKKKLIILLFLFNFFPSYTYSEIVYLDVQFILDNSEIGKYYKKKLKIDNDRTKSELDTEGAIIKKKGEEEKPNPKENHDIFYDFYANYGQFNDYIAENKLISEYKLVEHI